MCLVSYDVRQAYPHHWQLSCSMWCEEMTFRIILPSMMDLVAGECIVSWIGEVFAFVIKCSWEEAHRQRRTSHKQHLFPFCDFVALSGRYTLNSAPLSTIIQLSFLSLLSCCFSSRTWLFLAYVIAFVSLAGSAGLLIKDSQAGSPSSWPGSAGVLQCFLVLGRWEWHASIKRHCICMHWVISCRSRHLSRAPVSKSWKLWLFECHFLQLVFQFITRNYAGPNLASWYRVLHPQSQRRTIVIDLWLLANHWTCQTQASSHNYDCLGILGVLNGAAVASLARLFDLVSCMW